MNSLKTALVSFLKDESGPTAVEYAVMLALGTEQENSASFEREGGATWARGRSLVRAVRTGSAAQRAVIFAWSGGHARMWPEVVNTGSLRVRARV